MNDDTIQDLKQFIAATISQQKADLATKEDIAKLEDKISNLDISLSSKIDDLSNSVAEAPEVSNEDTDEQLKNHNLRITKLEQKTA
jgi:hypothetical protein